MLTKDHVCEMTKEIAEKTEKYNKCKQLLQVSYLLFQWKIYQMLNALPQLFSLICGGFILLFFYIDTPFGMMKMMFYIPVQNHGHTQDKMSLFEYE